VAVGVAVLLKAVTQLLAGRILCSVTTISYALETLISRHTFVVYLSTQCLQ